jgi:hypothetical protein
MEMYLLILSCLGDATACNTALPWQAARFGSQARCMVEGESIVTRAYSSSIARTNLDGLVITYLCRPYTEDDAKVQAKEEQAKEDLEKDLEKPTHAKRGSRSSL